MLLWNRGNKGGAETSAPDTVKARAAAAPPAVGAPVAQAPAKAAEAPISQPSLNELLLSEHQVSEEQMKKALERQQRTGEFIGEILIQEGVLQENSLISFIAKHCKVPHLSLLDYLIEESILQLVPREICLKYRLLPIDRLGKNLTVAMVNPLDHEALAHVRKHCPDLRIKPILCTYQHFDIVMRRAYADAKSGPVELSMSSFGLARIPGYEKKTPPTAAEKAPVPPPPESPAPETPAPQAENMEDIPEALEVVELAPVAAPSAAPSGAAPTVDSDAVLSNIFKTPVEEQVANTPADLGGGMMQEMASVMLNSMRDTYALLARRMELFQGVAPEEVARIFARSITTEFEEGDTIFAKGDKGDKVYAILGGEVRIEDENGEIAVLSRGDMFGEMALVSQEPRSAGARALTSTSLLALDLETLYQVMPREVSTQLLINIIVTLSERLRKANQERALG